MYIFVSIYYTLVYFIPVMGDEIFCHPILKASW